MKKSVLFLLLLPALMMSCTYMGKRIKGNGNLSSENRPVGNFTGIESHGSFDVYVSSGSQTAVKVEAEENLLPYIETHVDNNVLHVDTREGVWLRPRRGMKVYVTAPNFSKIYATGSGNIIGQTKITDTSRLDLHVNGNGDIKLEIDAPDVNARITGNGGIYLKGQSKSFSGELTGNGNIKAFDMMAENTKVHIVGNGNAEVFASVQLDVSIGGNGSVQYKGNAQTSTHITGNGNVKKID